MSNDISPDILASSLSLLPSLLSNADATADRLNYPDESLRHEYHRHFLMLLTQACVQVYGSRAENPDWMPHTSSLFPWGAPNPDTMYTFAALDAKGSYIISGTKGTESVASVMLRRGGPNNGNIHGATLDEIDIVTLEADKQSAFSFMLSPQKPSDYTGQWFELHPETTGIITRRITSEAHQTDGVWCIERIDRKPSPCRLSPAEIETNNKNISLFVSKFNEFILNYAKHLRENAFNSFIGEKFPDLGGMKAQMYYHGAWEIADDEALLIETDLPKEVAYWNIQLLDAFYGAMDSTFHQSAINDKQAHIDSDGRVRFIVSNRDPGITNWLATGGWTSGAMMHRWHSATDFPHPSVQKIKFSSINQHLPADTPKITDATRREMISARTKQYQSRRRW